MPATFSSHSRRWIGASALALILGTTGGASFLFASSQHATASTPGAQAPVGLASSSSASIAPPAFADLDAAVKPAVVSIVVEAMGNPSEDGSGDSTTPQSDQPQKYMAIGSGFAISADGYFVTNNHVVKDATKLTVRFANGDEKSATVVGTDAKTDLAVVKVNGLTNQPFVRLADAAPRVGDWVMAIGTPFGLGNTVTEGIVSALNRDIGDSSEDSYMQIDAPVNRGNSGGPDFNLKGEVVGVNTAIFSPNGGSVGIAFAIPSSTVKLITTDLIKTGSVTRGFLGISIQDVTNDIADSVGLKQAKGAIVTATSSDSPGERAGLRSGDIITAVDGSQIDSARDLSRTIGEKGPGATVDITAWRGDASRDFSVKLDQMATKVSATAPMTADIAPTKSSTGLTLEASSDGTGVLVQDIDPDSVAASKGIAVGDTILRVGNSVVNTPQEFEAAINAVKSSGRSTALIEAATDGTPRYVGLPLNAG